MVVSGADVAPVLAEGGVTVTAVFALIGLAVFGGLLIVFDLVCEAQSERRRERERRRRIERARGGES